MQNPFDQHPDIDGQHYLSIYALPVRESIAIYFHTRHTTEHTIIDHAAHSIPLGYTQLWILGWISAMRLEPETKIKPSQRRAAQNLRRLASRSLRLHDMHPVPIRLR
jgi:hypothetical protein